MTQALAVWAYGLGGSAAVTAIIGVTYPGFKEDTLRQRLLFWPPVLFGAVTLALLVVGTVIAGLPEN